MRPSQHPHWTMWKVDPVTRVAGTALLSSLLAQWLSSRESELCSEFLAWALLPIVFRASRRQQNIDKPLGTEITPTPALSVCIVTLSIATLSVFRAEIGLAGFLPALTPLLLAAEKYLGPNARGLGNPDSWGFSYLANTIWGTGLAAWVAIAALSDWDFRAHFLSMIPVVSMLAGYVTLTPRSGRSARSFPTFDIGLATSQLSLLNVIVIGIALGVETATFGFPRSSILRVSILGLTKAFFWYSIVQITRSSSWRTATAMQTFGIVATRCPSALSSGVQALLHVAASFFALGQTIHILPRQAKAKLALWGFFLVPLVPYLANTLAIRNFQSFLVHSQAHPVETIIRNAKSNFDDLLRKQSQTYAAAENEYRRRYSAEPPPGFKAWYEFAVSHQSPIIDEFDTVYDSVSPFWKLSGKEVYDAINRVQNTPGGELWLCSFYGNHAQTQCSHRSRRFDRNIQFSFNRLLKDLSGVIPNVQFLVNHLDEPRVLIPPERSHGRFELAEMSRRPVWKELTKFCTSQSRKIIEPRDTAETFSLPFVTNPSSAIDICQHPEYSTAYGFALSPTSFRPIEGAVPILSTGTLSSMGDILYPSPAYNETEFQYSDEHDIDWNKKQNKLYWAGSTTGGHAVDDHWRAFHRQRFVELAQNLQKREHIYLQEKGGVVNSVKSTFLNTRLFDVGFTRVIQCDRRPCRDQGAYFNLKSWADKDQALQSRLVFDLDGNGISGRYYKLLASKSVPLKQTLLREWHDDRLIPWVHYIPVSQSLDELPELVTYLTSTASGQERAREVAEQGREWFSRAFRDVDLTIYTYRLLLELARLQDPNRPAG